jgi:hypothetical protein
MLKEGQALTTTQQTHALLRSRSRWPTPEWNDGDILVAI